MALSHFRSNHWQANHFITNGAADVVLIPPKPISSSSSGIYAQYRSKKIDLIDFHEDDEILMRVIHQFLDQVN